MKHLISLFAAVGILAGCQAIANVDQSPRPPTRPINTQTSMYDVDYTKTWEFRENYLVIENPDYYKQLIQRHAEADSADMYDLDPTCDSWLRGEGMHLWHNRRNAPEEDRGKTNHCTNNLVKVVYKDFATGKTNNIKLFFEDYLPLWIENQAFTLEGYSFDGYRLDAINHYVRQNIFLTYYAYAPYYEYNTPDMDRQMLEYWEAFERHDAQSLPNGRSLDKCPGPRHDLDMSELYPSRVKMMSMGACANEAAIYAYVLLSTGLYHKSNDHINESLWIVQNIANAAYEDGATRDAVRGGSAPSYLMDVAWGLDRIAYEMEYNFNYNVYSIKGARGATVGDIIDYGVHTWLDPEFNSKYNWIDPSRGHGVGVNENVSQQNMNDVATRMQSLIGNRYWKNELTNEFRSWKTTQMFFEVVRPTALRQAREKN